MIPSIPPPLYPLLSLPYIQVQSIQDLQCEYLDLILVHWPVPQGKHIEAYIELQNLHKEGLVKSIGISNYAIEVSTFS